VISFAVLFAGESVFADVPGVVAKGAGGSAVGVGVGVLGLWFALICMATTRRFGWPRFGGSGA